MTQLTNQRIMNTEQGQLDLGINPSVIPVIIDNSETATLLPGTPVKLYDVSGKQPKVLAATADDDAIFGYIIRNPKDQSYVANDRCEIALVNSIMYMTAGAAIARGAIVESDVSEVEVITQSSNPAIGLAIDKATASGDLIRVLILTPSIAGAGSFTTLAASGAATLASTLAVTGVSTFTGNIVSNGNAIVNGLLIEDVNDYSAGAGALPITKPVIALTTSGAEALTLADGVEGQKLSIIMVSDGGAGTLTPANFGNGTTITFDDDGDSVDLIFLGSSWWVIGTATATVA